MVVLCGPVLAAPVPSRTHRARVEALPVFAKPSPKALAIAPLVSVVPVASVSISAPHSHTLPIISRAPLVEVQAGSAPVFITAPLRLQVVVPDGDPDAPICHSVVVGSRLPALAQACWAWYQVILVDGVTPA